MTYELVKQLKDAGFPQEETEGMYYTDSDNEIYWFEKDTWIDKELIAAPTLSELIEACGDRFASLYLWKKNWFAEGGKLENEFARTYEFFGRGDTPEEAVARLYLALYENNKKN